MTPHLSFVVIVQLPLFILSFYNYYPSLFLLLPLNKAIRLSIITFNKISYTNYNIKSFINSNIYGKIVIFSILSPLLLSFLLLFSPITIFNINGPLLGTSILIVPSFRIDQNFSKFYFIF